VLGQRSRIRDVPIPPSRLRCLDRFVEARSEERSSDGIFLGYRRHGDRYDALTMIGVYQMVKDAFRRARITKPVYPHLPLHSWMTQLSFIAGASTDVIAQHYAHLTKNDVYDAMIRALTTGGR
jgi:site-specific recombinase XerD